MNKRILIVLAAFLSSACAHEITSDERLDRETRREEKGTAATAEELLKLKCDDLSKQLAVARSDSTPEEKRLSAYVSLLTDLRERSHRFEDAMTRNPDLAYREGSEELVAARDTCVQASADVRVELETLVREVVRMPTVQEIKGGSTVTVARLDFELLRAAIEKLEVDDEDYLMNQVDNAEKKIQNAPAVKKPRRRGKR